MRRTFFASLALILAVALTGCGGAAPDQASQPKEPVKTEQGQTNPPAGGIAYLPTTYEVVPPGQAPSAVARELEQMRARAGTKAVVVDGTTYAVITAGEKSNGGYSVEVTSIGDSEGKLEVVYKVNSPKPGTMTTQAITYPSVVVKFQNTADLPVTFREAK